MRPTNDDSGGDDLRPLDAALRANREGREARYRMTNADIHYCANAIAAHHGLDPAVIVNGLANSSVDLLAKLDTPTGLAEIGLLFAEHFGGQTNRLFSPAIH